MKYRITLNQKVYEVEVEQGQAILAAEYEAAAPVSAAPVVAAAPVAAAPVSAPTPAANVSIASGELVVSPLPGTLLSMKVKEGESVKNGQVLALIEALKMENEVMAPRDGVVKQVIAKQGDHVEMDTPLLVLA